MKPTASFLLLCSTLCSNGLAQALNSNALEGQSLASPQRPIHASKPDSDSDSSPDSDPRPNYTPPRYRDSLLSLHKFLVDIPSTLGEGSEGEAAKLLGKYLFTRGYQVELQRVPPRNDVPPGTERYNVLAWPHRDEKPVHRRPRVLVTSHLDVVPPYIPYGIDPGFVRAGTVIRGRGSVDAKASVAAQITAVEEMLEAGDVRAEDLMLAYVIGEETTGDGMQHFSASLESQFKAAIFGEPTENKLACGHKGITGGWVRAKGKAGHSGYPELGKSATELLMRALVKVLDADLGSSERFGNTTVNVGRLDGGVAANVIAKDASAQIAIRVAAGNFTTGATIVKERLEKILNETDDEAFSLDLSYGYGPVECNCDIEGFETLVANYGTDVANLKGSHVSYLYGPGTILVAHGDNEALRVRDLELSVEGYKKIIKHALSQ